jgi:hypothetical protein
MVSTASPIRPSSSPDASVGRSDALATGQFPLSAERSLVDQPTHGRTVLPPPPPESAEGRLAREDAWTGPDETLRWLDEALADEMEIEVDDLDLEEQRLTPTMAGHFGPADADGGFSETAIVPKRR